MYFDVGDHRLLRVLRLGRVAYVYPVTVVRDGPDYSVLHLACGSPTIERKMPDGSPLPRDISYAERHAAGDAVGPGRWRDTSVLQITRPDESRSFWAFRGYPSGEFLGWYVNLQRPLSRTDLGFDTEDHVLDIVVGPDGSWMFKDEDELRDAVEVGRFTEREAEEIRAEGNRTVREIESGEWPLGSEWEDWTPEAGRNIPSVPEGWERL